MRRFRRPPLMKIASYVTTEVAASGARNWEIQDLRLRERSLQEANEVGDFVSNMVASIEEIDSNPVRMSLYRGAMERFGHKLPPDMVRLFVDASIKAELRTRREVAAARLALARKEKEPV